MIFNFDRTRLVVSFKKYTCTKKKAKHAKIQSFLVVTPTAFRSIFFNTCFIKPIDPNNFTLQNQRTLILDKFYTSNLILKKSLRSLYFTVNLLRLDKQCGTEIQPISVLAFQ